MAGQRGGRVLEGEVAVPAAQVEAADLPDDRRRPASVVRSDRRHLGEQLRDRVRRGGGAADGNGAREHPGDSNRPAAPPAARENGSAKTRSVAISTSVSPKLYSKKPGDRRSPPRRAALPPRAAARSGPRSRRSARPPRGRGTRPTSARYAAAAKTPFAAAICDDVVVQVRHGPARRVGVAVERVVGLDHVRARGRRPESRATIRAPARAIAMRSRLVRSERSAVERIRSPDPGRRERR